MIQQQQDFEWTLAEPGGSINDMHTHSEAVESEPRVILNQSMREPKDMMIMQHSSNTSWKNIGCIMQNPRDNHRIRTVVIDEILCKLCNLIQDNDQVRTNLTEHKGICNRIIDITKNKRWPNLVSGTFSNSFLKL